MDQNRLHVQALLHARSACERSRALLDAAERPLSPAAPALARAILDALDRGHVPLAQRLASEALRVDPHDDAVACAVASLRLVEGDAASALAIVEAIKPESWSVRLLRAHALLALGRPLDAHQSILDATRDCTAPGEARLLLALFESRAGDADAAHRALARFDDLDHLEIDLDLMRVLLACEFGAQEEAADAAARLRRLAVFPTLRRMILTLLASLGHGRAGEPASPAPADVEILANEILIAEPLLPTLLEAQRRSFDAPSARLLQLAMIASIDRLTQGALGHAAIAELTLHLDGADAARKWIDRGLEHYPMSAALVRLRTAIDVAPTDATIEHFECEPSMAAILGAIGDTARRSLAPEVEVNLHEREKAA